MIAESKRAKQLRAVRDYMLTCTGSGEWRFLADITGATGAPEASASARLRDLRRLGYLVERRMPTWSGDRRFLYRVTAKPAKGRK